MIERMGMKSEIGMLETDDDVCLSRASESLIVSGVGTIDPALDVLFTV